MRKYEEPIVRVVELDNLDIATVSDASDNLGGIQETWGETIQ